MDLVFAAEQYAQAQAAAVAAAQYYASAAAMSGNPGISLASGALLGSTPGNHLAFLPPGALEAGAGPLPGMSVPSARDSFESIHPPQQHFHPSKNSSSSRRRELEEDNDDDRHSRRRRRSTSRHRESSRRRSRDRSTRRDRRDRSRSPYRRRGDFRRERSPESEDEESYKCIPPNNTIMVRGLAQHISENDIRQDIQKAGLSAKDIRLIRKKETGASRGFAFIEFTNVEDAQSWMEVKQGVLMFKDQYRATMQYSLPREGRLDPTKSHRDWFCGQCGVQNFRRRDLCFKCGSPKTEYDVMQEGNEEVSVHPTTCLLLRGLDALTTEESVSKSLSALCTLSIKSIQIARDSLTNMSRGFAYVEMSNLPDAILLHNQLLGSPPLIDDKLVAVSYYKNPIQFHGPSYDHAPPLPNSNNGIHGTPSGGSGGSLTHNSNSQVANLALAAAQWSNKNEDLKEKNPGGGASKKNYSPEEIDKMANYSASMYAKNAKEEAHYYEYYKNLYNNGGDTSAASIALREENNSKKNSDLGTVTVGGVEYKKYPSPDVSSYQYDETSGYYYDPISGLYYDANSTYYFNSNTSQYHYWASEHMTFLPVSPEALSEEASTAKKKEATNPKDKVKTAKKIAKDMERWAKSMNQRKEAEREKAAAAATSAKAPPTPKAPSTSLSKVPEAAAKLSDVAFSAMIRNKADSPPPPNRRQSGLPGLANYGSEEDSGEDNGRLDEDAEEEQHTNWSTLACLLCKRQFTSKEKLSKHNQMSDLHKQNLAEWRNRQGMIMSSSPPASSSLGISSSSVPQYRDRAKERRDKFGSLDEEPRPNHLKEKYLKVLEQADTPGSVEKTKTVGLDNIGNRMLQKMGWKEGLGLGKSNQGRTSIIEVGQRNVQAGLGSSSSRIKMDPSDSYKDCVKKTLYQRYHDLN